MVYVLDIRGNPMMPTKNSRARRFLKQKKAKIKTRDPFTIQLTYEPKTHILQEWTVGIDTGSGTIGSAVIDSNSNVLYRSNIQIRNDIKQKMDRRRAYRRTRRNRKTRYRKARFLNRKKSIRKGRFSATMTSKIEAHKKEIEFIKKILPITKIIMEVGNFDVALLNNSNLKIDKSGYQKGLLYWYENIKSYVRTRDKYTCQHCKKKKSKLEVHHIIFRSNGGSDKPENLITLCHGCHSDLHQGKWSLDKVGKRRGSDPFATQMNSIRIQLQKTYPDAEYVYGYKTKVDRLSLGIDKDHCNDAVVIASQGRRVYWKNKSVIYKKCISKGEYQLYKGIRSEKKITREKIAGFRRYDKVTYLGRTLYIRGRRKSGTCDLVDIFGEKQDYSFRGKGKKTPKLKECKRISSRKTWLIQTVDKRKGVGGHSSPTLKG